MFDISAARSSAKLGFQDGPLSINPDYGSQSPMVTCPLCLLRMGGGVRRSKASTGNRVARFFHRINTTVLFKRQNTGREQQDGVIGDPMSLTPRFVPLL